MHTRPAGSPCLPAPLGVDRRLRPDGLLPVSSSGSRHAGLHARRRRMDERLGLWEEKRCTDRLRRVSRPPWARPPPPGRRCWTSSLAVPSVCGTGITVPTGDRCSSRSDRSTSQRISRVAALCVNGVGALASVAVSLRDPVSYRLGRRLEFPSQLSRCTSGPDQLDHLLSECRWVRRSRLRHCGLLLLLLLAKRISVHETGFD